MTPSLVTDLLIILASGFVAGLLCRRLGISLLVGYLVVGALIGAAGLGWVRGESHDLARIAQAGVLLLLFSIGLEFSLDDLAHLSRYLLAGGSLQMLLTGAPVAIVLVAVAGMSWRAAVLWGAAIALSSTVLVFKALAERGQTSSPHGRRAIAVLLFQDMALVPLLLVVPLVTGKGQLAGPADYLWLVAVSAAVVAGVLLSRALLASWVVPLLAGVRSLELVVLFTLVVLGGVTFVVYRAGLPPAIGAFAAGLIFSGNRLTSQVDAVVLPLRESFAAVFFVSLGLLLEPQTFLRQPWLMLGGLALILVWKALAAAVALRLTGLAWRPALGTGLGLAQMGEFSFVLALAGRQADLISHADYQRLLLFALASIIATPWLLGLGLRWAAAQPEASAGEPLWGPLTSSNDIRHAVVIGAGPVGGQVASRLEISGVEVCLIDRSPVNLYPFAQQGFPTVAGDGTDPEVLGRARTAVADLVVICVPDDQVAARLVRAVRSANPQCRLLARCRYLLNVRSLRAAGANVVVSEEAETSQTLARLLSEAGPGK